MDPHFQAICDFARTEFARISANVIEEMRTWKTHDVFPEVSARHFWDEYSWWVQERPFDLEEFDKGFDEVVTGLIQTELEKLAEPVLTLLSLAAVEGTEEEESPFDYEGVEKGVRSALNEQAGRRDLALIGPHAGYEIEGDGLAWSVLSERDEATSIALDHLDALLDKHASLSFLADDLADAFIIALHEDEDGDFSQRLVVTFEREIRKLIIEKDILPSLATTRTSLLVRLDS